MTRDLAAVELLAWLSSVVVAIWLLPFGNVEMAGAVFVNGAVWSLAWMQYRRWRWPARLVSVEESIDLPHPSEAVWDLIEPPENAPRLDPTCVRGYRVPGSPEGVGAQQAIQHLEGMTSVIEVIEFEPGRRAVTRTVSPRPPVDVRVIESVDPIDGGCRYTIALQFDVGRGGIVPRSRQREWRAAYRGRLERTRDVLAGTVAADSDGPMRSAETSLPAGSVRWLRTPFAKETILLALCVVLFGLTLFGAGHQTMAVTVVVAGTVLLAAWTILRFRRWPARVLTVEESIDLPDPCEAVWDLIDSPEKAPLLDPTCVRCYRVPGTPEGLGAQYAQQYDSGMTLVFEVIEYEPGHRATTRIVSPPQLPGLRSIESVDPVDGGCRYSIAMQVNLLTGEIVPRSAVKQVRARIRELLERTRDVLESSSTQ